jgi:hypothetical protein
MNEWMNEHKYYAYYMERFDFEKWKEGRGATEKKSNLPY